MIFLYLVFAVLVLYALFLLFIFLSVRTNLKWFSSPSDEGKFVDSNGKKIFYRVKGKGEPVILAINSIGSSQAEWWLIQNEVGQKYRMITFDRPGYNWSTPDESSRLLSSVSDNIDQILKFERIKRPVFLVSNGTGTVFARHYAMTRPQNIAGALFINPFPIQSELWFETINNSEDVKKPAEVIVYRKKLAKRGYFRIFSPYKGYHLDQKYKKEIIEFFSRTENYDIMEKELKELEKSISQLNESGSFPSVPLWVLLPANESLIREWIRNEMTEYSARQLGRLYHELASDFLKLSPNASITEIEDTGEFIHLSKPDIVVEKIIELAEKS